MSRKDVNAQRKVTGTALGVVSGLSGCLAAIVLLSACAAAPSGPAADANLPLSVRETLTAAESNANAMESIVLTAQAVDTQTALEAAERANSIEATRQALALGAITVEVESARANLQIQAEAITHTIAVSEAQAASLAEQRAYSDTLAAQVESASAIAEGETTRSNIMGWLWTGAGIAAAIAVILICGMLTIYMVLWFQSGTRKLAATEAAHIATLANMIPARDGLMQLGDGFNPYRAVLRLGNEIMPAYEFLGLPAPTPETFDRPVERRDSIPINSKAGRVQTEIERGPELDKASADLRDFLANCEAMHGAGATRIPSQRAYVERWKVSPNTWQDNVNALMPQHLEGRGTKGTVVCSRRYPTIGDLHKAVRSGELKAGAPRMARVQADQVEIVEAGD